jgi:two-component sensor histidine kinase
LRHSAHNDAREQGNLSSAGPEELTRDVERIRILRANRAAALLFEAEHPEQLRGTASRFLHPDSYSALLHEVAALCLGSRHGSMDCRYSTVTGKSLWLRCSWDPPLSSSLSSGIYIVSLFDITDLHEQQEDLSFELDQKEVLLREFHHRVKNNLTVLSGLLRMQKERKVPYSTAENLLEESCNRIKSMALVHDQLYNTALDHISFDSYVRSLLCYLIDFHTPPLELRTHLHIPEETNLPPRVIFPCGLIINELVTNALKHAYEPRESGLLMIHLELDEANGHYILTVADNGKGMPPEVDFKSDSSFGFSLVTSLAKQLEGTAEWRNHTALSGTRCTIRFPIPS